MTDPFKDNLKKKKLETHLKSGVVYIYINTSAKGVVLPKEYLTQPTTTLQISHNFQGSLQIKKDFIETVLYFGESFENCIVPYNSLWAIGTPETPILEIWHSELPEEVLDMVKSGLSQTFMEKPVLSKAEAIKETNKLAPSKMEEAKLSTTDVKKSLESIETTAKRKPELKAVKPEKQSLDLPKETSKNNPVKKVNSFIKRVK